MHTAISQKRQDALNVVDMMPGDLRQCVHEFGLPIVSCLMKHGIRDARHIREVVRECWGGARQAIQRADTMASVNQLLGLGIINVAGLERFLWDNNMAIVHAEPTREMLDASMAEVVGGGERMTKEEKHRRRLRAAIRATMK